MKSLPCSFAATMQRYGRLAASAMPLWLALAAAAFLPPAHAATDPCGGAPECRADGALMASVVKVNVARRDAVTAYQSVRLTVRFRNLGERPIAIAYRQGSGLVTDNNGLAYKRSMTAMGIGLVTRDAADPQFQLAPGETRDATFEGVLQYSMRRQVAGNVFGYDMTIVELAPLGGGQVRTVRDHALSFANLTASTGAGATGALAGSMAAPTMPAPGVATEAVAVAAAPVAGDPCAGIPACQAQGPFVATVVGVNVTRKDGPTAYQGVRTTLRIRNLGDRPLILAYRQGSGLVTDNNGLAYRWSMKATGIGMVTRDAADPQFQLAPGEAREAAFEGVLQYSSRNAVAGNLFTQDLTLVQLEVVSGRQVRMAHDYALSFSNLGANSGSGAGFGIAAGNVAPAEAVGKIVDLFKALKK